MGAVAPSATRPLAPSPGAYPAYPGYSPYAYGPSPAEAERRKQVKYTRTGLLLLLIGTLLSWIPIILYIGYILLLIGAILVILGRKAFGAIHSRYVVIALVLFFVGILGGIALGIVFALALFSAAGSQDPATIANAFVSAFKNVLIGAIVLGAISGVASVVFTYALQQQLGKGLLWAGYGAQVAITIATYAILAPLFSNAAAQAAAGGTHDPAPLVALQNQANTLGLLRVIPALLFAAATYLAWSRVNRGEIPPPSVPPGMTPMAPPPSGPSPPK